MRYCDKSSDLINFFSRQTRTVSVFPVGLVGALGDVDAAGIIQRHLDTVSVSFLTASNVPRLAQEIV